MSSSPTLPTPATKNLALRWSLVIVFLLIEFALIGYAISGSIQPTAVRKIPAYEPWPEDVIEIASKIPVQDGGRVKPLSTFARFQMLQLHGTLKMKVETRGDTLTIKSTEWLLDCLFRPELANQLPIFRLDNADVVTNFGLEVDKRRTRISFDDITPIYDKLMQRGQQLTQESENRKLNPKEKQVTSFAQQVLSYQALTSALDFARDGMQIPTEQLPPGIENPESLQKFSHWMAILPEVSAAIRRAAEQNGGEIPAGMRDTLGTIEMFIAKTRFGLNWIPPYDESDEWRPLGRTLTDLIEGKADTWAPAVADLQTLEKLAPLAAQPESKAFLTELTKWQEDLIQRSANRGWGKKLPSEISYYERNYFKHALAWFIFSFVVCVISWLVTQGGLGKGIQIFAGVTFIAAVLYLVAGILHRSLVMGRPPVGNLYDTIPFITAGAVVVLGIGELLTRRRLLLSLASFLGMAGLFLAFRFEYGDAKDHMDPLVAVLNSNYWLATHVVTVTLGYSGGLVACFLSQVYVHLRLAGVIEGNKSFQRFMTRAAYGIVCFTLFFSLVGTVLGGIWANDSWGRFWGWDPKENGALLIVLWSLLILHARLAGWMKDWGVHLACIFGGMIVAFSWWHVNMLEVGLHSYGFIKGGEVIWFFYLAELISLIVGVVAYIIHRVEKSVVSAPKAPLESGKV
ncbi:cytochrome c biogenesis protein CcsA [Akkermansiaceae bacterium]|nr:cytochrome c biogenesis protein CcsA [Akkermansiaceae bacterium]MDB4312267.1 cytochrome c biogenesis protein CcsA [bacterium]MDB4316630.1 cytochrome c biogenesis protein CcsA [Akkermansiaceae bacterium]MDB4645737.1 cytochrome c biogenesis protein CcsA [Akkermansiaceae bacterium]MDB4771555.1 cytochrome c biogenesis protein CcsA [Akkermansiaceae bacterium]